MTSRAHYWTLRLLALIALVASGTMAVPVVAAWVAPENEPNLGSPLTFSPPLARQLTPVTTQPPEATPVAPPEPACVAPLTVSVVGDSMFEVGENRLALSIGSSDRWRFVNWDARSGHTVESHEESFTQEGDIVVVSFMYNDIALHGWPGAREFYNSMLDAYADRELIWVSFAEGTGGPLSSAYDWLRSQALDGRVIMAEFGPVHDDHPEWAHPDSPLGGFHIGAASDGIDVLARTMRQQIDLVTATHFGPDALPCPARR